MADRRQHFLLLSQIFHFLYILLLQKFFLLLSLDYIWCPTALQLDTLKLDTLKTLLLGYSTFCYCTRPEFKSTAEFFLFKKTASTDIHCYSTSTTKNHYFQGLVYRMRTFYCNPLLLMFFPFATSKKPHYYIVC